jgi:elongation factor Ts
MSSRRSDRRSRRSAGTRASPRPRWPKIIEGRLNGFFKDVALLDQPYAKDDKKSVTQVLAGAKIIRFAQVEIG